MLERVAEIEDQLSSLAGIGKTMKAFMEHTGLNCDHNNSDSGSETEEPVPAYEEVSFQEIDVSVSEKDIRDGDEVEQDTDINKVDTQTASCSLMDRCTKYEKIVKTAPAVQENIAKFVSQVMTHNLDTKSYQDISEKYEIPDNIPFLVAPKVNPELWGIVPFLKQQQDVAYRKIQEKLVSGICPLVQALEECGDKPEFLKIKELISDSVEFLGNFNMSINNTRRDELRPCLKNAAPLANRNSPVTDQLFGDEVESEIKKIEARAKLTESIQNKIS